MDINEIKKIPNLQNFKRVPVFREIFADFITPICALRILRAKSEQVCLLESVQNRQNWGRYTFLCHSPLLQITAQKHSVTIKDANGEDSTQDSPKRVVREILAQHKTPKIDGLPSFNGGLVGYFSYDYIRYNEDKLDFAQTSDFGDLNLCLFNDVIIFDNLKQKIVLVSGVSVQNLDAEYPEALKRLDAMEALLKGTKGAEFAKFELKTELEAAFSEAKFCEMVAKAKHYIHEGDIFQVVLSNPIHAKANGSIFDIYRALRTINPSPYMFYFCFGDTEIAGSSPETLARLQNGKIFTYPLAGSRPRGKDAVQDAEFEKELLADEKELAEHNMLVDLGRNDVGKISKIGSVSVPRYKFVVKYSHIMHIASEVCGELEDGKDALDVIDSILPAGTLSGAPKIRACEIINELEGDARGVYGGAVGYIDFSGDFDTCIGIRLIYKKGEDLFVRSGAGIVYESDAKSEHTECANKAAAILKAAKMAQEGL